MRKAIIFLRPLILSCLGWAGVLLFVDLPSATANSPTSTESPTESTENNVGKPGWQDWQPVVSDEPSLFDSGFSNLELGGFLEYEYACEQTGATVQWYRLSHLVTTIGTGEVEYGCRTHDALPNTFAATHTLTAVSIGLDTPHCLVVNTDVGNGLIVRESPNRESAYVGFLSNGQNIFQISLPASIAKDPTGRQWMFVEKDGLEGWASVSAAEGQYVNFTPCAPDV